MLTAGAAARQRPSPHFPLKIGLLADTQLTSQNGFPDFSQRSKRADRMVSVAIRPPALECLLSAEMLRIALEKLTQDAAGEKRGVDAILYLGDAANSGGTDEIETFFSILEKHRAATQVPIFVLIGNHDYLGCGNIPTPWIRHVLLNRDDQPGNPALSKYQVLKRISRFNRDSAAGPGRNSFRYVDNQDAVERNNELDHNTGLYLCGVLTYAEQGRDRVEILLLDTSDYQNAPDWSSIAQWGYYGVIGSLSFEDKPSAPSQIGYLRGVTRASTPDFRLMASHYPKEQLDRITLAKPGQVPLNVTKVAWEVSEGVLSFPAFSQTLNHNLEGLLLDNRRNYWVSGHTHVPTMPPPSRIVVGGLLADRYFNGLNVGSTTDHRAHVAIVESCRQQKNSPVDDCVGYREIPLFDFRADFVAAVLKAIGEYARDRGGDPNFQGIIQPMDRWAGQAGSGDLIDATVSTTVRKPGELLDGGLSILGLKPQAATTVEQRYHIDVGATLLGLNKRYQEANWGHRQTQAAAAHLGDFVKLFVERCLGDRDNLLSCLAFLAGAYECGKLTRDSELNPASLKNLWDKPR